MADKETASTVVDTLEEVLGHPLRRSSDIKTMTDLSGTVGRLEQSIENTNVALRDFANRTNHSIDRLTRNMEDMGKTQLLGKQTNWGQIASWAGVFVVLLGLVVYQPLQELRSGWSAHEHDGHPESVITRIQNNEQRFADIMDNLQKQITLLENVDRERMSSLTRRVEEGEKWILGHQESSPREHAIYATKIEHLEQEVLLLRQEHSKLLEQSVSDKERILDLEREAYSGAAYRAGRPVKPTNHNHSHTDSPWNSPWNSKTIPPLDSTKQ